MKTILIYLCVILLVTGNTLAQYESNDRLIRQDPDSAISIGEVRISAYRLNNTLKSAPGSISVLSAKEISVYSRQDLTILNSIPGIIMQSGTLTTSRIVIRGMGSRTPYNTNRIKAYLNNIPLTTADGIFAPDETDLSALGRIEVIKGPSSALYGSGLGGSINMYTPVETKNNLKAGFQYGSFNTAGMKISGTSAKNKTILWGNFSHLGSGGFRENNNYIRNSALSTLRWEHTSWSLNSTLMLTGVKAGIPSSVGKTQFETAPETAAANWLAIKGYKKYIKGLGALSLKHNLSGVFSGEAILFGKWDDDYERRPFNNLRDRSSGGGFRYEFRIHPKNIQWISGTEIIYERYTWKLDKDNIILNNNSETRNQYSFFTMLNYSHSALNLSAAAAVNYISYYLNDMFPADGDQSGRHRFDPVISPRLGANYQLNDHLAVYASAGHGFSMPSTEETLLPEGLINNNIKPEKGFQYETGFRLAIPSIGMEADAAIYFIDLSNLLVTKRISEDIFTGINAGKTRHWGLELQLKSGIFDVSGFPGKLSTSLSYTLSRNKFIDFNDNGISYNGRYLPGIPDQVINLGFSWLPGKALTFTPLIQYTGYQYLTDDNALKYPGYLLISLRASSDFRVKGCILTAFAGMNNFTGTAYASMLVVNALPPPAGEPRYYYPGLPRNFYVGISLNL